MESPESKTRSAEPVEAPVEYITAVYDELCSIARHYMRRQASRVTLQTTAIVHEAYVRLRDAKGIVFNGRTHYLAVAAQQMRRVLIDHARSRSALKRAGGRRRVTLDDDIGTTRPRTMEILALSEALDRLAEMSERRARVAELRLFAGSTVDETARILAVSARTVKEDWRIARAWLASQLERPGES